MDFLEFRETGGKPIDPQIVKLSTEVIGAAIEVHRHLKPGHLESAYHKALVHELTLRQIQFRSEYRYPLVYKGVVVGEGSVDLLVGGLLVVELKSVETLHQTHVAQVLGYLQALDLGVGLLINFNVEVLRLGLKRVLNKHR